MTSVQPQPPIAEEPDSPGAEGAAACDDLAVTQRVEALLLSTERPLSEARLGALLALPAKGAAATVREAVEALNAEYEKSGRAFRAERLAGGWQLMTIAACGPLVSRLHAERQQTRLSQAALETLSIIAYRQPIMRAEIEAIRGVACGEVLRGLLERRLVKVAGRAEELGRPMLYGTTSRFLKLFGLAGLSDLPEVEGLAPGRAGAAPSPPVVASEDDTPEDDTPADDGAAAGDAEAAPDPTATPAPE